MVLEVETLYYRICILFFSAWGYLVWVIILERIVWRLQKALHQTVRSDLLVLDRDSL